MEISRTGARFSSSAAAAAAEATEPQDGDNVETSSANFEQVSGFRSKDAAPAKNKKVVQRTTDLTPPKKTPKRYISLLPRVPSTSNINHNSLMLDSLMNGYRPLQMPVAKNLTASTHGTSSGSQAARAALLTPKRKSSSILDSLKEFKESRNRLRNQVTSSRTDNYNPYFSKDQHFVPYTSIFTNSILNTQQHNTELFNLPLSYLEKLKPYQCSNKPGDEFYRDDLIVVKKIELEESELEAKKKRLLSYTRVIGDAKNGTKKQLEIDDIEEFFGFK
ncbi:hypothetical protein LJB42_003210 [Komagataella kurtzmanii]|nr:hypothetical protein LJB42_003210 [Komagataella kurtzmanii]